MARKILVCMVGTLACMAAMISAVDAEAACGRRCCRRACCPTSCCPTVSSCCYDACDPCGNGCSTCAPACDTACVSYYEPTFVTYRDRCGYCATRTVYVRHCACASTTVVSPAVSATAATSAAPTPAVAAK